MGQDGKEGITLEVRPVGVLGVMLLGVGVARLRWLVIGDFEGLRELMMV